MHHPNVREPPPPSRHQGTIARVLQAKLQGGYPKHRGKSGCGKPLAPSHVMMLVVDTIAGAVLDEVQFCSAKSSILWRFFRASAVDMLSSLMTHWGMTQQLTEAASRGKATQESVSEPQAEVKQRRVLL